MKAALAKKDILEYVANKKSGNAQAKQEAISSPPEVKITEKAAPKMKCRCWLNHLMLILAPM